MTDELGETLPEELQAAINQRSAQLLDEFSRHAQDVSRDLKAFRPDAVAGDGGIDRHKLFEGWAFQKLASLQLLVENLADRVAELEGE